MKSSVNLWGEDVTVTVNENGFLILRDAETTVYIEPQIKEKIRRVLMIWQEDGVLDE
jgi:hypothetical protein